MFNNFSRRTQWTCKRVNCERRFIAKQVTNHHAQNERHSWVHSRHRNDCGSGIEALLAFLGNHNWQRLVRTINRNLFRHIRCSAIRQTCCTHNDHWFTRQVNVLFIFSDVTGNRLVTQLGKLDSNFFCSNRIEAVSDNRPITASRSELARSFGNLWAKCKHLKHRVWNSAQCRQQLMTLVVSTGSECCRDCA